MSTGPKLAALGAIALPIGTAIFVLVLPFMAVGLAGATPSAPSGCITSDPSAPSHTTARGPRATPPRDPASGCRRPYQGPARGTVRVIIEAGMRWLGTPYSWGGGTLDGPSEGFAQGSGIVGFDCSSLTRYMAYQGTGHQDVLPRTAAEQFLSSSLDVVETTFDLTRLRPGDLMFWGSSALAIHHVAMYIGGGQLIEAPHTGSFVHVVPAYAGADYFAATEPSYVSNIPSRGKARAGKS
jgi:cell wall-associated NlpC family hydrolase